jgi:hypothetical protein
VFLALSVDFILKSKRHIVIDLEITFFFLLFPLLLLKLVLDTKWLSNQLYSLFKPIKSSLCSNNSLQLWQLLGLRIRWCAFSNWLRIILHHFKNISVLLLCQTEATLFHNFEGKQIGFSFLFKHVSRICEVLYKNGVKTSILIIKHKKLFAKIPILNLTAYVAPQMILWKMC